MKKFIIGWLVLTLFNINLLAQEGLVEKSKSSTERKEIGNLVLEGIPNIDKSVFERTSQYQNVRSASFVAWHPENKGVLISTRFAETSQLHYVNSPGSYRKQLTFFKEPINGA